MAEYAIYNVKDEKRRDMAFRSYCRIHDFCFAKGSAINCEDVWLNWLREAKE